MEKNSHSILRITKREFLEGTSDAPGEKLLL